MKQREKIMVVASAEERFSPHAQSWTIPFALFGTARRGGNPPVSLASVKVNGQALPLKEISFLEGNPRRLAPVDAGDYLPAGQLAEWHRLRMSMEIRTKTSLFQAGRFSAVNRAICERARQAPGLRQGANEVTIPVRLFSDNCNAVNSLQVFFREPRNGATISFTVMVTVTELSCSAADSEWAAGCLQIHSTFSDGRRTPAQLKSLMQDRGYHFIYLSDGHHTGRLTADRWSAYRRKIYQVSDSRAALFPGVETAVGTPGEEQGHLLVYGTNKSIAGLEEHTRSPQETINAALHNEPAAPSSAAIAHPFGLYGWQDFTVFGHTGMELMSGPVQLHFNLKSGPSRLWRRELTRHLEYAASCGSCPSPRAGTDWHGYWFEPLRGYVNWVSIPLPWHSLDYAQRKAAVDRALFEGRTVASRRGSLGYFTLDASCVGSALRGVPAGTSLPLVVHYRSAQNGSVTINIFRNNLEEKVFRRRESLSIGESRSWEDSITFPGGRQLYWLYAEGSDYVYSSPILVTGNSSEDEEFRIGEKRRPSYPR